MQVFLTVTIDDENWEGIDRLLLIIALIVHVGMPGNVETKQYIFSPCNYINKLELFLY